MDNNMIASTSPTSPDCASLNDSWVDVFEGRSDGRNRVASGNSGNGIVGRSLNPLVRSSSGPTLQNLERLLLDAQKESAQSSLRGSLKGSLLGSLPITPDGIATPPNSLHYNNELIEQSQHNTDWLWDWSAREHHTKEWNLSLQPIRRSGLRQWIIRRGIFSKDVLSILLLSNVVSLALGAGIGYTVIFRRSF